MGGLPQGRPTLVSGSAGCCKTLLGIEFLVRGAIEYNEPGVFMAFEESEDELASNVTSLGMDLRRLVARKKLRLGAVRIERSEIEETGEYDLGGLFIRLGAAIDSIGAKRVALDTIEVLFAGLSNHGVVRAPSCGVCFAIDRRSNSFAALIRWRGRIGIDPSRG